MVRTHRGQRDLHSLEAIFVEDTGQGKCQYNLCMLPMGAAVPDRLPIF